MADGFIFALKRRLPHTPLTAAGKIRVLLVLLCASLFFTAIIVPKTYTPVNNLNQTAKILESNLQGKEEVVNELFGDKLKFEKLKTLNDNPEDAFKAIKYYTNERSIWFVTTVNDKVNFWCGVKGSSG